MSKHPYVVLVSCNTEAGGFAGNADGIQIYDANGMIDDPLFQAMTLMDDDPVPFWETKTAIAFHARYVGKDQICRHKRLHYRCKHGAQHVGNIFWNAYFVDELTAYQMALDFDLYVELTTEGEWADNIEGIRKKMDERCQAIRNFLQHPVLPGMKRVRA